MIFMSRSSGAILRWSDPKEHEKQSESIRKAWRNGKFDMIKSEKMP